MPVKQKNIVPRYILRTCDRDGRSYGGFAWPLKAGARVEASDWSAAKRCGNGLHGLWNGIGDSNLLNWDTDAKWIVAEVDGPVVDLGGKVKVRAAIVRHVGDRASATSWLMKRVPGCAVVGANMMAGENGVALVGDRGTATAGINGTATAGLRGTATAGEYGTATAGDRGTATAGHRGTATAGDRGTATAGEYGTATAGYGGTATAGHRGTATAGHRGTATAGDGGELHIRRWDAAHSRYRTVVGYVGEDGIEANVAYQLDGNGRFVPVST